PISSTHSSHLSLYSPAPPHDLHSFPTRRSSDLWAPMRSLEPYSRPPGMPAPAIRIVNANGQCSRPELDRVICGLRPNSPITITRDRKSTRLNSSHVAISYAVFCLKKKKNRKKQG